MKIYLSGPMRGYKQFNFPMFDKAAAKLTKAGFHVANPAAHDRQAFPDIETWEGFESGDTEKCPKFILPESLAWDFAQILSSDAIVLLPGWEKSSGAKAERFVAESVGKMIFLYSDTQPAGLIVDTRPRMKYPELNMSWEVGGSLYDVYKDVM